MAVRIENHRNLPLSSHDLRVLKTMFADYDRLVIRSRFESGFSGSRVYLVRSIKKNAPDMPSVVKIDLYERIEKEWQAYTAHVQYRLSNVAEIRGKPVNPPGSQFSGLWYKLAGSDIDEITTLHHFLLGNSSAEEIRSFLEKSLFKYFSVWWVQSENFYDFNFRTSYDDFLPLNLIIQCTEAKEPAIDLYPESIYEHDWSIGEYVRVSGFRVERLIRDKQALILDVPEERAGFRIMVSGVGDVTAYEIGEVVQQRFVGLITENRRRQLFIQAQEAVGPETDLSLNWLALADGKTLPNPLTNFADLLSRSMNVKFGPIHGDLSLENVLVNEESRWIYLIDFVNSRQDHVLRDLLHMEMTVVNRILPVTMSAGETAESLIHNLYRRLHCAVVLDKPAVPPAGQEKVFAILHSIRQAARPLLYNLRDWREYYVGLFIYLLGSLRYADLDTMPSTPRPKQLAFWGAATILELMENEPDCSQIVKTETVVGTEPEKGKKGQLADEEPVSDWDIDKIVADWQVNALSRRLILFNILKDKFSMTELRELAFGLGLDLEELPPGAKSIKAQELIGYFERRGQIRRLLEAASKARPDIPWG